jgi:hypothetical protein
MGKVKVGIDSGAFCTTPARSVRISIRKVAYRKTKSTGLRCFSGYYPKTRLAKIAVLTQAVPVVFNAVPAIIIVEHGSFLSYFILKRQHLVGLTPRVAFGFSHYLEAIAVPKVQILLKFFRNFHLLLCNFDYLKDVRHTALWGKITFLHLSYLFNSAIQLKLRIKGF